ncbi:MAG: hypothetical protein IH944_07715 [Armatimonadetes bacterium]|nr:hypothetical protein [Armatimonadota bacterium]
MRRLRDVLKFKKPKTRGFAITDGYYLSILAARAQLPTVVSIANPKGEGGAVPGFAVPLRSDSKKADLGRPLERGQYAIASLDRKTVLKMLVLSKEEAGFNPSAFVRSELGMSWPKELRTRVEATWLLLQLTFESYDPELYPSLDFLLKVAKRGAELTDGLVADPLSRVYKLPDDVISPRPENEPVWARDHVKVEIRPQEAGLHCYTLGLQKFGLAEFEVYGVKPDVAEAAELFLIGLSQASLKGEKLKVGVTVGEKGEAITLAEGGLDRGLWEGVRCLELISEDSGDIGEAMVAWLRHQS